MNDDDDIETIELHLGKSREALRTDDEVEKREEEAIKLDGLNVAQIMEMRDKAEKHHFQAEVNRMMKLILNSLYRNKDVSCRAREVKAVFLAGLTKWYRFTASGS